MVQPHRGVSAVALLVMSALLTAVLGKQSNAGQVNARVVPAASVVSPATAFVSETPSQADDFVNAIGVNTSFGYDSSPAVQRWSAVSSALISSGIRHIRDGDRPTGGYLQRLNYLGQHGIRHSATFLVSDSPATIRSTINTYMPYLDFVEPENEYDGYWRQDPNWAPHIAATQKLLYATVRANGAWRNIRVFGPALSNRTYYSRIGRLDAWEDEGNFHYSTCDLNPGTLIKPWTIPDQMQLLRVSTLYRPLATTEAGYGDDPRKACWLPDSMIAKYEPRDLAERWNDGQRIMYIYDFSDMPANPLFAAYGMLDANGIPKRQYYAVKSMIGLLSDPNRGFVPRALTYSLTGNVSDIHHMLLQKHDGSYVLMLWVEKPGWNSQAHVAVSVPAQGAVLQLRSRPNAAVQYTYDSNGYLHWRTLSPSTSIGLTLTDSISFIVLK